MILFNMFYFFCSEKVPYETLVDQACAEVGVLGSEEKNHLISFRY